MLKDENTALPHILQDTSAPSMLNAIEASLVTYYVSFTSRLPGAKIYDTPALLWIATGEPSDLYNGVFRSSFDATGADTQIDAIQEEFRRRQVSICWQVGPSSQPADLRERLLAHGFTHDEDEPGMALDLLALHEEPTLPAGLQIQLVENASMLNEWIAVWLFGAPPEIIPAFQELYARVGFGPDCPWRYYLGILDGRPVATSLLFFGAGVSALHTVVTRTEVRHRGIGTAMTQAALQQARQAGYRIAILTASTYGVRIYERLGFQKYYTISKYNWSA